MNGAFQRTWQRLQSACKIIQRKSRTPSTSIGAPTLCSKRLITTQVGAVGRQLSRHTPSLALVLAMAAIVPVTNTTKDVDTENDHHIRLDPVDGSTLTPKYLLQQMSVAATEAAFRMSTQALLAYLQAQEEYRKSLDCCLDLIEYGLMVLGNQDEVEKVWEAVVVARARADDRRANVKELERLLSSVSTLVNAAGETAFLLDSQFVTTLGSQHQYLVEREREASQRLTREKEKDLLLLDERVIRETTAHDKPEEEK